MFHKLEAGFLRQALKRILCTLLLLNTLVEKLDLFSNFEITADNKPDSIRELALLEEKLVAQIGSLDEKASQIFH